MSVCHLIKVEPSNHDSELNEMSELFIWDVGSVVVRKEPWPPLRVDTESCLPAHQLCDLGSVTLPLSFGRVGEGLSHL